MWKEVQDPNPCMCEKTWFLKRTMKASYYRDSLGRIIYFKTRKAACRRAQELNKAGEPQPAIMAVEILLLTAARGRQRVSVPLTQEKIMPKQAIRDREKERAYWKEYNQRPERKKYQQKWEQDLSFEKRAIRYGCHNISIKKINGKTQGRKNHRKAWTEQEIMLLWNTAYTTQELAFKFKRTYRAIESARSRFVSRRPGNYCSNAKQKIQYS